jgi:hypothetical protein
LFTNAFVISTFGTDSKFGALVISTFTMFTMT